MLDNPAYPLMAETVEKIKAQYLAEEPGPWIVGDYKLVWGEGFVSSDTIQGGRAIYTNLIG